MKAMLSCDVVYSDDENTVRDHSSEIQLRAVLSCGGVCFSIKVQISFLITVYVKRVLTLSENS